MAIPSSSWDETSPLGSSAISLGDDAIRLLKTQIREVIDVDHDFPSSGQAADVGQHKQVTLQEQADLGTGAVGATILGSQTVATKGELCYVDEDDNTIQITTGGKINAAALGGVYAAANVAALATMMNLIYPVGSIYINDAVSTNPGTLLGVGTWAAITDKMIIGVGSTFSSPQATGGATTATIGITNLPSGVRAFTTNRVVAAGGDYNTVDNVTGMTQGSGTALGIMNPYYAAYIWRRTV